ASFAFRYWDAEGTYETVAPGSIKGDIYTAIAEQTSTALMCSGNLWGTVDDLTKFVTVFLNGGQTASGNTAS
ncbi:hypothetical protein KIPB_014424, partial [Kipferlia bialata]